MCDKNSIFDFVSTEQSSNTQLSLLIYKTSLYFDWSIMDRFMQ